MANKFYVVWAGRETGIFNDWATTQAQVTGFKGAKYKSYRTRQQAEEAFNIDPDIAIATPDKKAKAAPTKPSFILDPAYDIHIFTDGGCNPNPGPCGSGVVVYEAGKLSEMYHGGYLPEATNNIAELRALQQALLIAESKLEQKLNVQVLSDSTYSIKAMTIWAAAWKRNGWTRRGDQPLANAELIADIFQLFSKIRRRLKLVHVKAHAGIEGNESADRLSTLAIKGQIRDFIPYDGVDRVDELIAGDGRQRAI